MIATVILVAALFTSAAANGPSGSQSYSGYSQPQQLQQQQYQPNRQQDRWYSEVNQASYVAQSSAATPEAATPPEEVEQAPLPEGWSEHLDPNSGQYYYYNAVDGTTSWDRPQAPEIIEQGVGESANKPEDSRPSEHQPESTGATDVAQNPTPEQERQETPENTVVGGINAMTEKSATVDSPPDASWQSNQNTQTKQPGPSQPSGIERQQTSWGGQGQSEHSQADEWGQQPAGGKNWGQSDSIESSVVGGEREVQKGEFQGQPPQTQPQEQGRSGGWGLPQPTKTDESPQKAVEPWGVSTSPEPRQHFNMDPREQIPPPVPSKETQPSSSDVSPDNAWGMPGPTKNSPLGDRPQNTDPTINQRQPWQEQRPSTGNPQRPPPVQQDPRLSPPQQQPARPQYGHPQYPPQQYGSYNPNAPPGQGQPDPRYGGQSYYGRGYPPQQPPTGQLVSQTNEDGTSAVKEALSTTWKGLLGFGNKTREVVGTAKDQVVTGATAASQTLSARSSSMWESAKTTVGGVFENNDSGSQPPYSLSGHSGQPPQDGRAPPNYQGRPTGPNQGYPNAPGGPSGRGPPPRNFGGPPQQPGRYGPPIGQQPRYGGPPQSGSGAPPGRQQPPGPNQQPPQQQMKPPGYPNMQPRRDQPYPQTPNGQERGPMQSQYGSPSSSQPPAQGGYPPQQRPPYSGPPGAQPNRGPGMPQGTPQQEKASDPWDHPGLMGDY